MAMKSHFRNGRGFTLIEVLISIFITGILATAAFQFYSKEGHQSEVQYDVAEMRSLSRASLFDIRKTLHSAGYKLSGHPPFAIRGDSLFVYFSETKPVDTVEYFLREYSDTAYLKVPGHVAGMKLYYLMKQMNSGPAVVFADFITGAKYTLMDSANIFVSLTTQTPKGDNTYQANSGFRKLTVSERVHIRNIN